MKALFLYFLIASAALGQTEASSFQAPNRPAIGAAKGAVNAGIASGSDIGAKINDAWASCDNSCEVDVPFGNYTYSTTIAYPVANSSSASLVCDLGTTLTYTGVGDAIALIGSGETTANVYISGCRFWGTSGAANIIHSRSWSGGTFNNIQARFASNGNAILNEGVNMLTISNSLISDSLYGIHNVGYVIGSNNYGPNEIEVHGGEIANNTMWGVLEDGTLATVTGPSENNTYQTSFERNGSPNTGQVFIQRCDNCHIVDSYIETYPSDKLPQQVLLGDSMYQAKNTTISGNIFLSAGTHLVTNSIVDMNSIGTIVDGNIESGIVTNFYYHGPDAQQSVVGCANIAQAATSLVAGVDTELNTLTCNAGGAFTNSMASTSHGYGFNTLTGLASDLTIRTRAGGTYDMIGQNSDGATTWWITNAGYAYLAGLDAQARGITNAGPISGVSNFYAPTGIQHLVNLHVGVSGSNNYSTMTQLDSNSADGCKTPPAVGASCTTTIYWHNNFADNDYSLTCMGDGVASGVPILQSSTSKLAGSVTIQTAALTAAAAKFSVIECRATHM